MRKRETYIAGVDSVPLAVTIVQAAKLATISRSEIYEALARLELPAKKLGRRTLILIPDLHEFLRSLPSYRPRSPK